MDNGRKTNKILVNLINTIYSNHDEDVTEPVINAFVSWNLKLKILSVGVVADRSYSIFSNEILHEILIIPKLFVLH